MLNAVVIPCWNIYHIEPSVHSTAAGFIDEHRATGKSTRVKGRPLIGLIEAIGKTIDREKFAKMVDEFYEHKGLDENGIPKPETLKKQGLENEPSHLL